MLSSFILVLLSGVVWGWYSHFSFHSVLRLTLPPTSFFGSESWKRKYKITPQGYLYAAPDTTYYRLFNLNYKERFPLSATVLVFLTDGYHFVQFVVFKSLTLAVALMTSDPIQTFIVLTALWHSGFGLAYYKKRKV